MRVSRLIVAAILFIVGLVWPGPGTGKIAGTALRGPPFCAAAGVFRAGPPVVPLGRARRAPRSPAPRPP